MKIILGFLMGMGFALHVHAASLTEEGTPYQTITKWYSQAQPVQYKEVANSGYVGKCFYEHSARVDDVAVLVMSIDVGGDRGPAFPPEKERKVLIVDLNGAAANFKGLVDYFKSNWSDARTVLKNENSTLQYNQSNIMGEVKRYGAYLVNIAKLNVDAKCEDSASKLGICNSGDPVKMGTPGIACYFYQELK